MRNKMNNRGKRSFLLAFAITIVLVWGMAVTSLAAVDVTYTTNGAKGNYIPGSSLMVFGKVANDGIGVPETSTFVEAAINGENIFYGPVITDENGYFKTGFNIPISTVIGQTLTITVNNSQSQDFVIKDYNQVINETTEPFELIGYTAVGYQQGQPVKEILANTSKLGLVFSKNTNYFKNNSAPPDLIYIGAIEKNEDCFVLYEAGNRVPIEVDLMDDGGDEAVPYTNIGDGKVSYIEAKKIINIKPINGLKPDTEYSLLIKKELVSNSSIPLKEDITVHYKTAKEDAIGGGAGGGVITEENNVEQKFSEDGNALISKNDIRNADNVIIKGNDLTVKINKIALEAIGDSDEITDASVIVKKEDGATFSDDVKKLIGDRPAFNISIITNGKQIANFGKGEISISIPYTLRPGENASNIVAYYINNDGIAEKVAGSRYNTSEKLVTFTVNHLSHYAVGYTDTPITPVFTDVSGWAEEYIYYLADRGIVNGRKEGFFAPNDNITRAEFATILARMSGDDLSKFTKSPFADVKANDWFMKSVTWASERGITKGRVGGNYVPQANISRQEMATMLSRYAENVLKKALPKKDEAVVFADESKIADFAKIPVAAMQEAGIINGKGNNMFAPLDSANRAEAAKMIVLILRLH